MITKALSSKLVLLVIGLAAGSGILIPAGYASFHPVTSSEIQNETILSVDIKNGEVKTDDIAPSAIGSLRIKDNDVKAQDIAADAVGASEIAANAVGSSEIATDAVGTDEITKDAVGASEIQGVDKLIFEDCAYGSGGSSAGGSFSFDCTIAGVDSEDNAVATLTLTNPDICYILMNIRPVEGKVIIQMKNICGSFAILPTGIVSVIVYDELPDKIPPF